MIINKTKKYRKLVIIIIVALLLIFGAFATWLVNGGFKNHSKNSTTTQGVDYNPPTNEQKDNGSATKGANIDNNTDTTTSKDGSSTSTNNNAATVSMTIPYAQQIDSSVRITTNIARVTSSGQCTLAMTGPGSATFSQVVDVQALSSSSTCKGFTVPVSSLTSGTWTISISYSDSTSAGNATSSVKVQ